MTITRSRIESPLGPIALGLTERGLCALDFIGSEPPAAVHRRAASPPEHWIAGRLLDYFDGELDALDEIPVDPAGTAFQLRVWAELRRIPVGAARSYQEVAAAIGAPTAARAVGAANGRNPISLVVPCHRVIAADRSLHGYGGGLWRKDWLLRHEGFLPRELFASPVVASR